MTHVLPARDLRAVIFDLDGVITHTEGLHALAWKTTFDDYFGRLAARGEPAQAPFTAEDYVRHVDGKPRYEGVMAFLASRGLTPPFGAPTDPPGRETVCGIGNRKDQAFNDLIRSHGVEVFEGSVSFVHDVRAHGLRTAVVSSSKNCEVILDKAGVRDLFDVMVDGVHAAEHGLAGKPAPDTFVHAAELMGLPPSDCAVVEDAVVGVQAGDAGHFAVVIGVDHGAGRDRLAAGGADVVVGDLGELTLE